MTRDDRAFEVQTSASRFMAKTFDAILPSTVNPGQKIAAATNFYTNVANHIATFGMIIAPFAKLSSSTEDYFVPSQEAQYLSIKAMDHKCQKYNAAIGLKIVPEYNESLYQQQPR